MYHIGKIIEVLSADEKVMKSADLSTFALLEMWDENLIIFRVNPAISKEIKEGNYVLVDYSPIAIGGAPVPKHEITAIISENKGKKIISKLKDSLEEKKKQRTSMPGMGFDGKMIG